MDRVRDTRRCRSEQQRRASALEGKEKNWSFREGKLTDGMRDSEANQLKRLGEVYYGDDA